MKRHISKPSVIPSLHRTYGSIPGAARLIAESKSEPVTSPELDNREAPTCACGAPVYADGLCVRCAEDIFDARNRALPTHLQRD